MLKKKKNLGEIMQKLLIRKLNPGLLQNDTTI